MEMDMDNTTLNIANIINEHHLANGDNFVGVPVKSFEQRGLGHHDVRIALSILTKNGAIKEYHRCWGHSETERGIVRYNEVSLVKPKTARNDIEAYEAYHVTIEPKALSRFVSQSKVLAGKAKKDGVVELTLDNDGDLYKEPKEKFCYQLHTDQEPLKIVLYFIKRQGLGFESTKMTALSLEKDPQYLRAEIGKINRIAASRLGLGKEKLIEAKQNSGYRLNPRILIKAQKEILSR